MFLYFWNVLNPFSTTDDFILLRFDFLVYVWFRLEWEKNSEVTKNKIRRKWIEAACFCQKVILTSKNL